MAWWGSKVCSASDKHDVMVVARWESGDRKTSLPSIDVAGEPLSEPVLALNYDLSDVTLQHSA